MNLFKKHSKVHSGADSNAGSSSSLREYDDDDDECSAVGSKRDSSSMVGTSIRTSTKEKGGESKRESMFGKIKNRLKSSKKAQVKNFFVFFLFLR